MKPFRTTMTLLALLLAISGRAQTQQDGAAFAPQWYVQPMVGASVHVGEGSLGDQLSPALQLGIGRQLSPVWGVRLNVAGWESRNSISRSNNDKYKWNHVQAVADATLSVLDLVKGYDATFPLSAYAFVGGGMTIGWNNDDAQKLDATYEGFDKPWDGSRLFLTLRGGVGASWRLNDRLSLCAEGTAIMLPDHFNSKKGKNGSPDWQFSLLVGAKITLGNTSK